ncbi:MAG: 30S ribosomal protein S13 [Candidatus Magasanikbacteria bacterium GW2011_GWA2_56_11]|uniref:Small ribosomal subunit protein uS13 n=1 Tax=Candidatus Magasanikbacteria bacterium GW2011_GWA2_56_11 TaxID=1619044 RepID=A0A0G2B886_9BACT|nr:MAG: 30S ribosomal protein S13 [Candidatus Magasanikbacteria bacterium GW2011_GWA2_56_11]
MRVAGVSIPREKRLLVALTYIYGVGPTTAQKIVESAGIPLEKRVSELTEAEEDRVRNIVEKQNTTEGDLRRQIQANIKRLKDIKCYRGVRHIRHLPVNGQRTKTNSRTVRGNKRNIATSGRKPSAQKT